MALTEFPAGTRVSGVFERTPFEALLVAGELAAVPWPALLVSASHNVIAASPAAIALLGMTPTHIAAIEERFEPLGASGKPVDPEERPLYRAARAELFEAVGVWRERQSGREMLLRFRGRALGRDGLLEIDVVGEDAERRATAKLSQLNEVLLGRVSDDERISIRELLRQLVLQACEITGARYGAMGVLTTEGSSLKDFIHVGMPEDTARAIGRLPEGKGLLGAVIREGTTIRVPSIADDSRSAGFPASHPPMTSFLGVPLRLGEQVFGNFYLADKDGGGPFTEEDALLVERFSAQASLTVAYARQAEQEERRLFDVVMRHAPHGIVYFPLDPTGEALGNPAAERMLGRLTRGNDPSRAYDLKHPDGTPMSEDELPSTRALRSEAVVNVEVAIERHGGTPVPALVSAAPVHSESGVQLGAVVIFQDISALKQLQRMSHDFLALVAHDLRTPLQSVLLQVEALLRRSEGEAAHVPITTLHAMRRNGRQLDRLIRDLLDASRVDARGIALDLSTVRLPELASSIVSQIEGTLSTHPVTIAVIGDPPPVAADPRRLEQIVTNLLENAAKYSAEGTSIRIVVAARDGGTMLAVQDQGPGISPQELPRLFDRYFQSQQARRNRRGLGLGLFITKGLVEAHGGRISVESTLGAGTTFRVWFPAAQVRAAGRGDSR